MSSVSKAAAATESAIKKIDRPMVDTFAPDALGAAASTYAIAVRKVQAAEREILKLKVAQRERENRIAELKALLQKLPSVAIHVWCANYREDLSGEVRVMEVPGWWRDAPGLRTTKIHEGRLDEFSVSYEERSWNIAPNGEGFPPHGERVPAEGMSDSQIAYNFAMEPGHLRWKPGWRYGVIMSGAGDQDICTLMLNEHPARSLADEATMSVDTERLLPNVPIVYPPCNGAAFKAGDEVLVQFVGFDRTKPTVIGFRRNPKKCLPPETWYQMR